jgi:uncharacterized protein YjiS (DUF1127 family)
MSTCTHESMTNHHDVGVFAKLAETVHVWRHRYQTRHELAAWSERDLHDIGLSRSDIAGETDKPFWRA